MTTKRLKRNLKQKNKEEDGLIHKTRLEQLT